MESSKYAHENGRTSSSCGSFELVCAVSLLFVPLLVNRCVGADAAGPKLVPPTGTNLAGECDGRNDTATGMGGSSHTRTGMLSPAYSTVVQAISCAEVAFTRKALSRRPTTAAKAVVRAAAIARCMRTIPGSLLGVNCVIEDFP